VRLIVVDGGANNELSEPENRGEMLKIVLKKFETNLWEIGSRNC
jgi:hypothetical protein